MALWFVRFSFLSPFPDRTRLSSLKFTVGRFVVVPGDCLPYAPAPNLQQGEAMALSSCFCILYTEHASILPVIILKDTACIDLYLSTTKNITQQGLLLPIQGTQNH